MPASVTARKANVELLRCLLMALIVLGHCRHYGDFVNPRIDWCLGVQLMLCAVILGSVWHDRMCQRDSVKPA